MLCSADWNLKAPNWGQNGEYVLQAKTGRGSDVARDLRYIPHCLFFTGRTKGAEAVLIHCVSCDLQFLAPRLLWWNL
jgi:hypothetical protein